MDNADHTKMFVPEVAEANKNDIKLSFYDDK